MYKAILVASGGAVGSVLRWYVGVMASKFYYSFPYHTLIVNVVGSLLMGMGVAWLFKNQSSDDLRLLLLTGFCGGFTTFSAFSIEGLQLIQTQQYTTFALYIAATLLLGGLAVFLGYNLLS